jgi:hypothetical protein
MDTSMAGPQRQICRCGDSGRFAMRAFLLRMHVAVLRRDEVRIAIPHNEKTSQGKPCDGSFRHRKAALGMRA